MDCQAQRTLFLKANGSLVCEDDAGEQVELGKIEDDCKVDLASIVRGPLIQRMRDSMLRGEAPFPLVCNKCAFLRADAPITRGLLEGYVQKIQVETTLACKLRCPGCSGFWQIKNRPLPLSLTLEKYEAMLQSCKDGEFDVKWIEYCGQGEPLSHKQFPEFMASTKRILPYTRQRVITNGNFTYDERFPDMIPDELFVSCDGFYQDTYEQYRINGDIKQTLAFMKRAVERAAMDVYKTVVWKYIIFAHNDTDRELIAAQEYAKEIGVNRILFVLTHSEGKSLRFGPGSTETVPIINNVAAFNNTPVLQRVDAQTEVKPNKPDPNNGRTFHTVIDELRTDRGAVYVRGWAIGEYGASPSELWIVDESGKRHDLILGTERPDVDDEFPQWNNPTAGFYGHLDIPIEDAQSWTLVGKIHGRDLVAPLIDHELPFETAK